MVQTQMIKKCLLAKCKDLVLEDILWGLSENGMECGKFELSCNTLDFDEDEAKRLTDHIKDNPIDAVFTMNFSPTVALACKALEIPYASWIYDCPIQSLYADQALFDTNYFFIFDKYLLEVCKKRGLKNCFYLPLAANITRMGQLKISDEDEKEFGCDVSFVGTQYVDGRFAYYRNTLSKERSKELDDIACGMLGRFDGADRIHNVMSDELIREMVKISQEDPQVKLGVPSRLYFEEVVIARAVAYTERRLMMEKISDLCPCWFGAECEEKDRIEGVVYRPPLKYLETLPKVYNLSRINLSSTLHCIYSGIPLRVFDIIGAGGFILTNYQPEIEELFDIGKEIVVYHSFEEMRILTKFFLEHENERMQILVNGYDKVCNEFNYRAATRKMLEIVL